MKKDDSIGVATMTEDRTIILDLRATSPDQVIGDGRLVYPPKHSEYAEILKHLGGLKPGETKPVKPFDMPAPTPALGLTEKQTEKRVSAILEAKWNDLKAAGSAIVPGSKDSVGASPGVGWICAATPPFATAWPLGRDQSVLYYAYARGLDSRVKDGERVAAPWARLTIGLRSPSAPKLELIRKAHRDIGIQGFRPVMRSEVENLRGPGESALFQALEGKPLTREAEGQIKRAYCNWQSTNSVIAKAIKPQQRSFFEWLQCE